MSRIKYGYCQDDRRGTARLQHLKYENRSAGIIARQFIMMNNTEYFNTIIRFTKEIQ